MKQLLLEGEPVADRRMISNSQIPLLMYLICHHRSGLSGSKMEAPQQTDFKGVARCVGIQQHGLVVPAASEMAMEGIFLCVTQKIARRPVLRNTTKSTITT